MSSSRFYTPDWASAALVFGLAIAPAAAAPASAPAAITAPAGSAAPTDPTAAVLVAARRPAYRDGSYPGQIYDAYYGLVQVQANVQGGRLVSIDVLQYPSDRRTSRAINSHALPALEREVVQAQSTRVNIISGATLTSSAYLRSLADALADAGA